ncbi:MULTISPECIES: sugar ABC transporter substrate-binding protein [Bacillus]|uniref:sugar ABC transporter substrate-binding protein n=1 Tax=Bacillus TaxID=1386 RepID=UPI0004253B20|nr:MULTISPECIES: substrate-binding domain-containing protein [Bacillus]QHZ48791.1 sugar ABC transporter substrate-binding protein [Bacillus sp. NSP9.1]
MLTANLKRGLFALVLFGLLFAAAGCSFNTVQKSAEKEEKVKLTADSDKLYVGFAIDTLKEERWYKDKAAFEKEVETLGGEVKTLAANGNQDVQLQQAELLINEGVDVLVVVPTNADAAAEIVDMAHKAGVKVISYDRLIRNADVDYYVSFDNEKVGELQAEAIVKKAKKGNFVYIGGSSLDNNAVLFRNGAMKVLEPLKKQGKIDIVFDEYTKDWLPEQAKKNMKQALKQNKDIDAVIAANDGTAGGAIEALKEAGLAGKIPVSGQDAELEGVQRIVKGTQTMTVYKPIPTIAKKAAETAIQAAKGEEIKTDTTVENGKTKVPSILLEPYAVTKSNINETVVKDGHLSKEDIDK